MSVRSRGTVKGAVLPSDPKWVVIEATDGDPRRWPTNTEKIVDSEGSVNFMQPVSIDDGAAIKWRMAIGQALAEMLGYPDLGSKKWVLKDWPEGYHFYDHHKGPEEAPRHDLYLVGSKNIARFRSTPEFIPHAYWLMTDPSQDTSNCRCKYCTKNPQRVISDVMGLSGQRQGGSPSLARFADVPRVDRTKTKRRRVIPVREGRVFATVRRMPKPIKLPKGPKQHVNPEREKDLRAMLGPKILGERRWAREGELVWVKLDYPVPVNERAANSANISFWPGIIEEVQFKAEVTPRQTQDPVMSNDSLHNHIAGASHDSNAKGLDPWTIVHKSIYKIKLLIASKTVMFGSDHILPYQSHAPDADLLSEVQSVIFDLESGAGEAGEMVLPLESQQEEEPEQVLFRRFQAFDPFPSAKPSFSQTEERKIYFETAAGAFAAAIQIASRLSMFWTPSDSWEYKMQDYGDAWSTSRNGLAPAEHAFHQKMLGSHHAVNGASTSQTRFQGLWWGPERIWMGDLVRLKLARYQVAPEGNEIIKKQSGAGKQVLSEAKSDLPSSHSLSPHVDSMMNGIDPMYPNGVASSMNGTDVQMDSNNAVGANDLGAASRSLFLRLDGLFVAVVASEDGLREENDCRMCGMLYELADDDWEPDGEEFGKPLPPKDATLLNGNKMSNGHSSTTMTPLNTVTSGHAGSTLADAINSSASGVGLAPPPSFDLFTPNPDLLSEPVIQTDIVMTDGSQPTQPIEQASLGPDVSQSLSATVSSNTLLTDVPKLADNSVVKAEATAPTSPPLSGPLKSAESIYPTPPPPFSLKFRPILRDGHEVVMPLTTLAGRYYPGLLSNSLLRERVQATLQDPDARESRALRALEGLIPGALNAVDPIRFLPRRGQMLREAENVAWGELIGYWRRRASQEKNAIRIDVD